MAPIQGPRDSEGACRCKYSSYEHCGTMMLGAAAAEYIHWQAPSPLGGRDRESPGFPIRWNGRGSGVRPPRAGNFVVDLPGSLEWGASGGCQWVGRWVAKPERAHHGSGGWPQVWLAVNSRPD